MRAARLTFPEAPGPGARRGGLPAHSRSPRWARGGSNRDSGNKEVEARARARIPGAGGAPAPRPRPATHGAESRQPLSLFSELRYGVVKGECKSTGSLHGLLTTPAKGPGDQAPGSPRKTARTQASLRHRLSGGTGGSSSTPRIARETLPSGPRGAPEAAGGA